MHGTQSFLVLQDLLKPNGKASKDENQLQFHWITSDFPGRLFLDISTLKQKC